MESVHLVYAGALLPFAWGVAHLFPTRSVVRSFGAISADNRHIIAMEWIVEGVALIFTGILLAAVTVVDARSAVASTVYLIGSAFLLVLAVVSLYTGFRVSFLPFRLCPVIFSTSAILITLGWNLL